MSIYFESVDYYVLVNNEPVGAVIPGQGLCHGDPLSLCWFIIYAEGLSSLIRDAEDCHVNNGTRVCTGAPLVSHLLFVDDCFLFFNFEATQAQIMKHILTTYVAASWQAISLTKYEIYCSCNASDSMKLTITNILRVQSFLGTRKYLGLPSMIERDRITTFSYIKDRVWYKKNSWSSKCTSNVGRELMIKSLLQAIPT